MYQINSAQVEDHTHLIAGFKPQNHGLNSDCAVGWMHFVPAKFNLPVLKHGLWEGLKGQQNGLVVKEFAVRAWGHKFNPVTQIKAEGENQL